MDNNPLFDLKGKTAVITGSSRGIGKAIAVRMAQYGAKVMISSRKIDACNEVVEEIKALGGEAYAEECNISSKDALQNLCDVSYEKLGKVDILVLNAASNPYYGPLAKITDEAFDKVMNNNVKSNLWLSNMIIPKMPICADRLMEKYQIKISYYMCGNYIKNYLNEDNNELSLIAYKLKNGMNKNEVILVPKNIENSGFFEKFFQLFS